MTEIVQDDFSVTLMGWGRTLPTPDGLMAVSRQADRLGYHAIGLAWMTTLPASYGDAREGVMKGWPMIVGDHPGYSFESLAVLPLIAHATERIKLGFNAFAIPTLHPYFVARYLATLDAFTGGRVATAFGFGLAEEDGTSRMLEWLGSTIPSKRRGAAAEESIEVIRRLWTTSEPFDHDGEFFSGRQMVVEPKPLQAPYPELWWAGERKRAIKLAARYGRYLELQGAALLGTGDPVERIRDHYVPALHAANVEWGGSAEIAITLGARVTERPWSRAERAKHHWYENRPDSAFDKVLPVGTPEQCAEVIHALREAGVAHFALDFSREGMDDLGFVNEQLAAWANDVVPLVGATSSQSAA